MKVSVQRFRYRMLWLLAIVVLAPLAIPMPASAQFYNGYQMEFGRSRVQFKEFFWTYYKFKRFDTYFYLNGKELAVHTAKYVSKELPHLENELDTYLEGKIQFIIFNNLNELKQSNIGLAADEQYNIGGVTHVLGNKVVLYFDGSLVNFDLQIREGIIHVLLSNAIFGTNLGSQMMNNIFQSFPAWYTKGLITYLSDPWNTEIDNWMRNVILSGKYKKFTQLTMDETLVTNAGHSFWRFIALKYGKAVVPNIINMTQVSRNVETGFQYVLGASMKTLYKEWFDFYKDIYQNDTALANLPDEQLHMEGRRVLKRFKTKRKYSELQVSPDGVYATFATNESGKYKIWLYDLETRKLKKIFTGGYKLDEKVDYSYPLIAWHPTGKVMAMIVEKKELIWLWFYDVDERKWNNQNIFGFEKIVDFSYSQDGRSLVFSAVQKGQSDIFVFHISSGSYEQLTNDIYDDLNPHFLDHSSRIIFSSNRTGDTLHFGLTPHPNELLPETYDVFILNYKNRSPLLRRVTNTPLANEMQPMEYAPGYVSYLSDENGIYNEYIGKLDSTVAFVDTTVHYRYFTRSFPVTNFSRNITEHCITPRSGMKTFIMNRDLYDYLYTDQLLLPGYLQSEQLQNTSFMNRLVVSAPAKTTRKPESKPPDTTTIISPPVPKRQRKSFRNVMKNDQLPFETDNSGNQIPGKIDLENYQLDKQGIVKMNMSDSTMSFIQKHYQQIAGKQKKNDEFVIPKQRNYNVEFSVNKIVTQIDFSYLNQTYQPFSGYLTPTENTNSPVPGFNLNPYYEPPGLSPTFKLGITDLMEDYRIIGGFRISLDLVSKEYFASFANLKKRLDKEFVFQRRSSEQPIISAYVRRQYSNEGFFMLTYPLSRVLRVRATFSFRNETYVLAGPDDYSLMYPNTNYNWTGAKGQLIYDDSKPIGLNLLEGNRFMIFGEYNQLLSYKGRNLIVLGFDFRKYIRIHRQFIWANRFAGSTNFGSEKLMYYMGGTDSWIAADFEQGTPVDYSQHWAYQALATNMRGFNQNIRNGNNFLLINSELRFPVFRYLLNRPIKSEMINNFQLVTFGDVGTAWSGWNPYDKDNILFTRYVDSGPLHIRVQYEKDPIIGGFGFGARTKMLGYFVKGDLAWGVEDGKINKKPKFYFSLSLDF